MAIADDIAIERFINRGVAMTQTQNGKVSGKGRVIPKENK
jgi:hypothetical protein